MRDESSGLLRARDPHGHAKVTFVELFFDLVFVFAVTQLSHALLEHMSILGAVQVGMLLLAVWWVWIYTSWVTNWLDPERTPVRLLIFALMIAGLLLSSALPEAFEHKGLLFGIVFAAMQVGRSLFMMWALRRASPGNYRNFQRITAWLAASGVLWVAGGVAHDNLRLILWAAALGVEYLSPIVGFWTPGLGRSTTADWDVEGAHLAERCALFVIIALGESIVVVGATLAKLPLDAATIGAFLASLVGSIAMWWIYFDTGAERGTAHIVHSSDPGRLARLAYTYAHLPIIAGIILAAVSDELIIAHPLGHAEPATSIVTLGGPALYLAGNIFFKHVIGGRLPLSHLVGLALLAPLAALSPVVGPLVLGAATSAVLVVVAAWETRSLRRGRTARLQQPTEIG